MDDDLSLLSEAARVAAPEAMRHWRSDPEAWDKPGGAGPVSQADLAVNERLCSVLLAARPGYGWLSEETEDGPERLLRDAVFIVDPIDGTRAYLNGEPSWALSLAVARKGSVTAGVIFLPARDELYAAARGCGATCNGVPVAASGQTILDGARMLAKRPMLDRQYWPRGIPPVRREFRPSLAYRLALVASGRFDGMFTLQPAWEWDVAAGSLIAAEAGAAVTDRVGGVPVFNNATPKIDGLVAAPPVLHAGLLALLP